MEIASSISARFHSGGNVRLSRPDSIGSSARVDSVALNAQIPHCAILLVPVQSWSHTRPMLIHPFPSRFRSGRELVNAALPRDSLRRIPVLGALAA